MGPVGAGHSDKHDQPYLLRSDGIVARNVSIGESIEVCSQMFPTATAAAVSAWNRATKPLTIVPLFSFQPTFTNCGELAPDRLASIIIQSSTENCGNESSLYSCTAYYVPPNKILNTFINKTTLHMRTAYTSNHDSPSSASYGPLVRDIGHELGHAIGLAHYGCVESDAKSAHGSEVLGSQPAIMNWVNTNDSCNVATWGATTVNLTEIDVADFAASYFGSPAAPTGLSTRAGDGRINLSWAEATDDPAIDGYEYKLGDADWLPIDPSDASTTGFPLDDLTNGTTYTVQIRAVRGYIESKPSNAASATPTALGPPVITGFSATGTDLVGTYTWAGSSPRRLRWELHHASSAHGAYSRVAGPTVDSLSPVTFRSQSRRYWYKIRGQACEDRTDRGSTVTVCGAWSAYSSPVELELIVITTCDSNTRPDDTFVITHSTTHQETEWREVHNPLAPCRQYEYQRTVTTYTVFSVTYACVDGGWFGTTAWHTSTAPGTWSATGNSRPCNPARSATAGRYSLPAGDHELRWDGQRIAFTVPAGSSVELAWRQQDDGADVAVLSTKQGAELVVGADALSGDDQARATRFAGTTDPTLSAIAASLRDPTTEGA